MYTGPLQELRPTLCGDLECGRIDARSVHAACLHRADGQLMVSCNSGEKILETKSLSPLHSC